MTIKDHSTGLIYLVALPRKMAKYVAAKLENYFGFVGYPNIFHTGTYIINIELLAAIDSNVVMYLNSDNGKEFIAKVLVEMLMDHDPNSFVITGRLALHETKDL